MRGGLFILIVLMFFVTTTPFLDLRDPDLLLVQRSGNVIQQIIAVVLTLACLPFLWKFRKIASTSLSAAMIAVLLWQMLTVFTSYHPELSLKRYIATLTVYVSALCWILLPPSEEQFRRWLSPLMVLILGLSYFGVVFLPERSIHNLAEVLELANAGSWRGHFAHKNLAGPAMVFCIIFGIYLLKSKNTAYGLLIIPMALFFLYKTNNKTSIGLLLLMFGTTAIISRIRQFWLQAIIAYGVIGLVALFTLGTVLFPSIGEFLAQHMSDPTYTGRDQIWRFALSQLPAHPWVGFGYNAFWSTPQLINGGYAIENIGAMAGHAHNGYLNTAIITGLVGLVLALWWLLWNPLRDYNKSQRNGNSPQLALMYLQIWMFIMLYANLESPFFASQGPVWFSFLMAIFGLRLHARCQQLSPQNLKQPDQSKRKTGRQKLAPTPRQ